MFSMSQCRNVSMPWPVAGLREWDAGIGEWVRWVMDDRREMKKGKRKGNGKGKEEGKEIGKWEWERGKSGGWRGVKAGAGAGFG